MQGNLKVKNDFIFKRIFGNEDNKDILKSLLEAILDVKISYLKLINDTKLEKDRIDDKQGILDIRAIINDNENVNIEMQLINQYNMDKRTLFYWSKMFSEQLKQGNEYSQLQKTITINILDFNYIHGINKYHSTYHLREDEFTDNILTDILEIHFIEFPKFEKKSKPDYKNALERWLLFMDNASKEVLSTIENQDPAIKKASSVLDYLANDEETVRLYEAREKVIHDEISRLKGAKREGIQQGIQQGEKEATEKIALNMISQSISVDIISKVTGLKDDEILKLKKNIFNN